MPQDDRAPPPPAPLPHGAPRLLLVEDAQAPLPLADAGLEDGHELVRVHTAGSALSTCRHHAPDLILLAERLADGDGIDLCRQLKGDAATRDIPVIVLSTAPDAEREAAALDAGAGDYLVLPMPKGAKILQARIRAQLSHKYQADLLHRMAFVDGMTGIANRRYFDERLAREWRRCARNQVSLGLVLLDVDYFKRYNDHFGHQAGDECLRQITAALAQRIARPGDLIARYGGEEFVCLLPDTDLVGVRHMAEMMRQLIADLQLPHPQSDVAPHVTISLGGTVCVPQPGEDMGSLLRKADRMLYRAKGGGRNSAVVEELHQEDIPAAPVVPAPGPGALPPSGAATVLGRLAGLLAAHDAEALRLHDSSRRAIDEALGSERAASLARAIHAIDFPRALQGLQQTGISAPPLTRDPADQRARLLLVDDSPDLLHLLVVLLRDHYRLQVAITGEQALQLAERESLPDLVLLDVLLPGINGLEVCRRLKANQRTANIPVLFLSAKSDIADETAGLAAGAADYISKPVSPPILLSRVRAHLDLAERVSLLRQLVHYASDAILVFDEDDRIVEANERVRDLYAFTPAQMTRLRLAELVSPEWREDWQRQMARLDLMDNVVFESEHRRSDGSVFPVEANVRRMRARGAKPQRLVILRDIGERVRTREQMMVDAMIFAQSTEAILVTDPQHRILSVNQAFTRMTGYSAAEAVGRDASFTAAPGHADGRRARIDEGLQRDGRWSGELLNMRRDGSVYPEQQAVNPVAERDGRVTHLIFTGIDISARRELEQRFLRLANYDLVTDLPNRFHLREQLERAVRESRASGHLTAVLNINLERFRTVNEGYGHALGDEVLRITARRIQGLLGERDLVARLGADNFVCVASGIDDSGPAARLAEQLLGAISAPIRIGEQHIGLAARIGIAIAPADGDNADLLLRHADVAASMGKGSVGGTYTFYRPDLSSSLQDRRQIEQGLRDALARGELRLYYQPKVNLQSGEMTGAEALLRWEHPQRGLLEPDVFIPVAEENGQIVAIGNWVIHEACVQARRWQELGLPSFPISVNVSALQFLKGDLLAIVQGALADTGAAPGLLELEVTESVLTADLQKTTALLSRIRALGVGLAIDDFGTGYSSLTYLKNFPISTLKIDRSFIRDIAHDPTDASIIRGITALGHSLQLCIVAEGVENQAQLDFLRTIGCDEIQGYLFSRPLPPAALLALLQEWRRLPAG